MNIKLPNKKAEQKAAAATKERQAAPQVPEMMGAIQPLPTPPRRSLVSKLA